jgi:hypothetical protein
MTSPSQPTFARWVRFSGLLASLYLLGWASITLAQPVEVSRCRIVDSSAPRCAPLDGPRTTGTKRILFYRLQFAGESSSPTTVAEVESAMQQVKTAFRRMSYEQLTIEWVITSPLQLPQTANHYAGLGSDPLVRDSHAAALQAGFDFTTYDFDVLRTTLVPGWPGGSAALFDRWAWVANTDAANILHELGHVLGLPHANSWETDRTNPFLKESPPFPSHVGEFPADMGIDPDSLMGRPHIAVPGRSVEYGDDFDPMGLGGPDSDFNACFKRRLGWLAASNVITVRTSGVYRVHTYNVAQPQPGRAYALEIEREILGRHSDARARRYWVQYRTLPAWVSLFDQGVQLHWSDMGDELNSLWLDPTPDSRGNFNDAVLLQDRTFADPAAEIYLTPVAHGGSGADRWFDVAVSLEPASANVAPSLSVSASALQVAPGQVVDFTATAQDSDGDAVGYYWDLTEGQFASGTNRASRSWPRAGDFIVRCEVGDRQGGLASTNLVIRVGNPGPGRITGRVRDLSGRGLEGCRVQNGRVDYSAWDRPDFFATFSDSSGAYTLVCSNPATYFPGAFRYGYRLISPAPGTPVVLPAGGNATLDFVLEPVARVDVSASTNAAAEGQSDAGFVFTRSGSVAQPLEVWIYLGGTSGPEDFGGELTNGRVTIPAGTNTLFVPVTLRLDLALEDPETLVVNLVPRRQFVRTEVTGGLTNYITVYYPGWDVGQYTGTPRWFQTEVPYTFSTQPPTELTILDATPTLPRLSVFAGETQPRESPPSEGHFHIRRNGSTNATLQVPLAYGGHAINGVDFAQVPEFIVMPAGETNVSVPILPVDDDLAEGNERVTLTLVQPPELTYIVEVGAAEMSILDSEVIQHRLAFGERWGWGTVLEVYGELGRTCVIETSTNLVHWEFFDTTVIDFQPTTVGLPPFWLDRARFYRSHLVPPSHDARLLKSWRAR